MSSSDASLAFDAILVSLCAVTKLTKDAKESCEKLTPELLATAIKLASLPADHQENLTLNRVNGAVKLVKELSDQEGQQRNLTPEPLAIALKFMTRASHTLLSYNDIEDTSTNQESQSNDPITSEILADAIRLANE